jgi:hypothetical protein
MGYRYELYVFSYNLLVTTSIQVVEVVNQGHAGCPYLDGIIESTILM